MIATLALAPLAQVMILGTYHFADAGRDKVKSQIRDMGSAERQKEIVELVNRIARFRPTKIGIEATPNRADAINQNLAAYREGTYHLTTNEIDQIGFRLAKQCNITRLTAIDAQLDLDFDRLMGFFGMTNPTRARRLGTLMQSIGKRFEDWDNEFSVSQLFAIHNNPAYIAQSHQFYLSLCDANDGTEFPGADIVGDWYKRNARIYGNLRRSIQPGDRVLVLYGSAHAKILRELVQDSGDLALVEASTYLPPCPLKPEALRFIE
jgi:Family of unknown function (DUF5694)